MCFVPFVVKNLCSDIWINHEGYKDHEVMECKKNALVFFVPFVVKSIFRSI